MFVYSLFEYIQPVPQMCTLNSRLAMLLSIIHMKADSIKRNWLTDLQILNKVQRKYLVSTTNVKI